MFISPIQEVVATFSSDNIVMGKTWAAKVGQKLTFFLAMSIIWATGLRPNDRAPTLISNAISGSGSASSASMEVIGMIDAIEPGRYELNPDTAPDTASGLQESMLNLSLSWLISGICYWSFL